MTDEPIKVAVTNWTIDRGFSMVAMPAVGRVRVASLPQMSSLDALGLLRRFTKAHVIGRSLLGVARWAVKHRLSIGLRAMFRVLLNLIWLVLAGVELAVGYVIGGLMMMLTIVGIPFGLQAFKLAGFTLWPFGRAVVPTESGLFTGIGNIVWLILIGWWLAAAHFVFGILLCLTLIGIPMGVASFRMAGLALWPFGRAVVDRATLAALPEGSVTVERP